MHRNIGLTKRLVFTRACVDMLAFV
jgi:hypothetical protein